MRPPSWKTVPHPPSIRRELEAVCMHVGLDHSRHGRFCLTHMLTLPRSVIRDCQMVDFNKNIWQGPEIFLVVTTEEGKR